MSKVKVIDRRSERSIKSEREMLSVLHNPFIVNMYFAFQDFENLYLVMDLLNGGDLRYHIAKVKKFTETQNKFFIACIILGLEYIHSKGIIHRDIKPENLVCDDEGYIRITDFGVAKKNEKDNSSETSGTPGYMAPEVLFQSNHSFPADFFAVGIIAFEFMYGFRPYLGRNRKEIKEQILNHPVIIYDDDIQIGYSREAADFINKLLERKPSRRLGFKSILEIKNHPWMKDIDWELLYHHKLESPFKPRTGDNFDKKYCEARDIVGEETEERYRIYVQDEDYIDLFEGYTIVNYKPKKQTFSTIDASSSRGNISTNQTNTNQTTISGIPKQKNSYTIEAYHVSKPKSPVYQKPSSTIHKRFFSLPKERPKVKIEIANKNKSHSHNKSEFVFQTINAGRSDKILIKPTPKKDEKKMIFNKSASGNKVLLNKSSSVKIFGRNEFKSRINVKKPQLAGLKLINFNFRNGVNNYRDLQMCLTQRLGKRNNSIINTHQAHNTQFRSTSNNNKKNNEAVNSNGNRTRNFNNSAYKQTLGAKIKGMKLTEHFSFNTRKKLPALSKV